MVTGEATAEQATYRPPAALLAAQTPRTFRAFM
jgi:hypothetical protein